MDRLPPRPKRRKGVLPPTHGELWVPEPDPDEMALTTVLFAIADPLRLNVVRCLHAWEEASYSELMQLDPEMAKPNWSYHLGVLHKAGITSTRSIGTQRFVQLRLAALEYRFPGLIDTVMAGTHPPKGRVKPRPRELAKPKPLRRAPTYAEVADRERSPRGRRPASPRAEG
jgi:DNA-binding transcriptional ArsR family regulator